MKRLITLLLLVGLSVPAFSTRLPMFYETYSGPSVNGSRLKWTKYYDGQESATAEMYIKVDGVESNVMWEETGGGFTGTSDDLTVYFAYDPETEKTAKGTILCSTSMSLFEWGLYGANCWAATDAIDGCTGCGRAYDLGCDGVIIDATDDWPSSMVANSTDGYAYARYVIPGTREIIDGYVEIDPLIASFGGSTRCVPGDIPGISCDATYATVETAQAACANGDKIILDDGTYTLTALTLKE